MQESVLRKIIGKRIVTRKLAQEVAYVRLMAAHQFPERARVLLRHHLGNQFMIINSWRPQLFADRYDCLRAP